MGLAEYQEGREKGGLTAWTYMDKSVRRATSLALAGSYAQACRSVLFLRLVASCFKGEVV